MIARDLLPQVMSRLFNSRGTRRCKIGGMTDRPDIFTHVHQGIRRALFDASTALARAAGDPEAEKAALGLLDDALLFVARHGENEDALLLPLLDERAPETARCMRDAHQAIEGELNTLKELCEKGTPGLYLRFSLFIAHYLEHMAEEEIELEPAIRAVISDAELVARSKEAVTRTEPGERMRMLRLMLPALSTASAQAMIERMPEAVARELAGADPRLSARGA